MAIDLRGSYFSIGNPLEIFSRWLNPYRYREVVMLNGHELEVSWTRRAKKELGQRDQALLAEMQLYFSCVVQKRVLFHEQDENDYVSVIEPLQVCFRPVQAMSCAPEQFAEQHPVKEQFSSKAASRMFPKRLQLDYKNEQWQGEFSI